MVSDNHDTTDAAGAEQLADDSDIGALFAFMARIDDWELRTANVDAARQNRKEHHAGTKPAAP